MAPTLILLNREIEEASVENISVLREYLIKKSNAIFILAECAHIIQTIDVVYVE